MSRMSARSLIEDPPLPRIAAEAMPRSFPQYICPQCDADIPLTHTVAGSYSDRSRAAYTRFVRVLCPHCNSAFTSDQVKECDVWRCVELRRITAPAKIAELSVTIDQRLGTIRRPAATAA